MPTKLISDPLKLKEKTGFGHILHSFTEKEEPIKSISAFDSFLGIKELFISPSLGVLPHKHENQTLIIVNLAGTLVQKPNLAASTLIPENHIQLIQYKEGMHFEYNLDKMKPIHCLVFQFNSINKQNTSKLFKINQKNNFKKIFETKILTEKEQIISFYQGVLKKNSTKTLHLKNSRNGFIIYLFSGELQINETSKLKEKDTIALWDEKSISLIANKESRFFILMLL